MSIISSGYKAISEICSLGKHISPITGAMIAAATVASTGMSPIPRILILGSTLLGAYCNAKQDIQIGVLKNSLGDMNNALEKLELLTQQVEKQVPGLKDICNKVDGLIPRVDTRISKQEMRLLKIKNSLQAIKDYHNGLRSLNDNLESIHKGEIRIVKRANHLDELTKKEQGLKKDIGEQLNHWDHVVKELESYGGADNQRLVQEIRGEICNLIQAINTANALKLKEIKIIEQYNLSSPQERAQMLAKHTFAQNSVNPCLINRNLAKAG